MVLNINLSGFLDKKFNSVHSESTLLKDTSQV